MTHPNLTRAKLYAFKITGHVFYTIAVCGTNQVQQQHVRRTRQLQSGKNNKEELGTESYRWCAGLQLDRFYGQGPKMCPVGEIWGGRGVYYQALENVEMTSWEAQGLSGTLIQ